jgi:hypothetical protein
VASPAFSSAKCAMVDSGEVRRSAMYSKYNNGPRPLPWGTPAYFLERVMCTEIQPLKEVSAMQIGF